METLGQQSVDLLQMVRQRYESDHGKPGPEDEKLLADLRAKGFKITETHKGERLADTVNESGFERLKDDVRLKLYVLAVAAENYYFGVLIEDPFDRRAAESGLVGNVAIVHATAQRLAHQTAMLHNPVYSRLEARSKFRLGTISGVWNNLFAFRDRLDALDIHTPQAEQLRELANELPPIDNPKGDSLFKYTNMPHEQKIVVMEKMDAISKEILKLLRGLEDGEKDDSS